MFVYTKTPNSVDVSIVLRAIDSADGTPETGFDHSAAGIDLKYRRDGAANVDITEVALAALTTAHTDGGVEQIGNGYFRLDLPDAAVASGVAGVMVHGSATGIIIIGGYIQLDHSDVVMAGIIEAGISASAALTNDTGTQLTAINMKQALATILSSIGGVLAGASVSPVTTKPAAKPAGNTRISATYDSTGRTAVTLKVPD